MPPGTKLAMAARFNDPADPCKVLVATDAIGMGLNLNIRRIIFHSMQKLTVDPQKPAEKTMDVISVSQALQIAGRAGRFNTQWETGQCRKPCMILQNVIVRLVYHSFSNHLSSSSGSN